MVDTSNQRVRDLLDRWRVVKESRVTFNRDCEEIARRIFPAYANSFTQPPVIEGGLLGLSNGHGRQPAGAYARDQVDATGANALWKFASVLESMLTPRNSRWHALVPSDKTLLKRRTIQLWFQELTDRLFSYRENTAANFASQRFDTYLSLGAFGNGVLFTDKLDQRFGPGFRYKACPVGEVHFCENHQGMPDTVFRNFALTARQAVQKWGPERVGKKILECYNDPKKKDTPFSFLHCVSPREDYNPRRLDITGMMYQSEYLWEHAKDDESIIAHEGYHSFPYSVSRYITGPGEIYGRSPAMQVLPSLRLLNEQKKTLLKQGHRAADPPILAHDDGVMNDINMTPGHITYGGVNDEGRALIQPFAVGTPALNKEMMDDERTVILDAFLITVFQLLVETPEMTATEVMERTREKGVLLSPMMGRQQSEALGPQITREVDLLMMQGLMTPMPDMLREARGQYSIEYDSPLSRAQKAEEASGLFRSISWVQEYVGATGDKRPLQWIDFDTAFPAVMRINGVPASWISDPEKVAAMRQQEQEAAQGQQAIDAAPAMAAMAKTAMGAQKQQ